MKYKKHKVSIFLLAICLIVLAIMPFLGYKYYIVARYPLKYDDIVTKASEQYDVDKSLIFALIKVESKFNKNAISRANAKGLTQITDSTFMDIASKNKDFFSVVAEDIFDPEINILVGTYYLKQNLKKYEDEVLALCAYNAGPSRVDSWLIDSRYSKDDKNIKIPFTETREYVSKILVARDKYRQIYKFN